MEASRVNRAIAIFQKHASEQMKSASIVQKSLSVKLNKPHCLRQSDVVQIPAKILSILSDVYRQLSISNYLKVSWRSNKNLYANSMMTMLA